MKCILVASPGFVKDQFITYLLKEAVRQDNKVLLENRPKFMLVHSSSGHKYSLKGSSKLGGSEWDNQSSSQAGNSVKCILFCRNPFRSHCDKQAFWYQGDCHVICQLAEFALLSKDAVTLKRSDHGFFMCDFQAAGEVKALEDFYKMLQHEPDRAFYGWVMMGRERRRHSLALITNNLCTFVFPQTRSCGESGWRPCHRHLVDKR